MTTNKKTIGLAIAALCVGLLWLPQTALAAKQKPQKAEKPAKVPKHANGDTFLEAREAFRLGDAKKLARLAPRLEAHELAAYVEYYQLRMDIDQASTERVDAFLDKHAREYVAEKLRADWLKVLGRQSRWSEFDPLFAQLVQPDPELQCLSLRGRRQRNDPSVAGEALGLWSSLPDLPETCLALMRDLVAAGSLDADAIWERAHSQLESNRLAPAKAALALLPARDAPSGKALDAALDRPAVYLAKLPADFSESRAGRELALVALQRVARSEPRQAADSLQKLESKLKPAERAWAWGQIGWQGAQRHLPEARAWFRAAEGANLTVEVQQWRVRAALRAADWPAVRRGIEAMPASLASEPPWVYWLARSYRLAGRGEEANALFVRIAEQPNFYGNLAAEELGRSITLPPKARISGEDELGRTGADTAVRRALAFYRLNLRYEGMKEWSWALRGMGDRELLAAAEIARRAGVYDRAISAADRTRGEHDYGMRYLAPFDDQVRPAARAEALDDAWVYGLMRQESRFITDARSSAGASGLMQLMPATARWVAKKIGLKDYNHGTVNDTETNLRLGTSYLRMVMQSLDNHPVLASAAYNAGPGRARRWRDPERALEGAIYAETIPFNETRDYVKKVMSNAVYYAALFNGKPESLKARLGVIGPRGGDSTVEELP
jgi:soluble lytic murein transglycosylase